MKGAHLHLSFLLLLLLLFHETIADSQGLSCISHLLPCPPPSLPPINIDIPSASIPGNPYRDIAPQKREGNSRDGGVTSIRKGVE